jgi:hyaluronan synthase
VEQDAFRESFAVQQREGLGALAELSSGDPSLDDELAALLAAGGHHHEVGPRVLRPGALDLVRDDGGFRPADSYRDPPFLPPEEVGYGSLAHEYDIPDVTFRPLRGLAVVPLVVVAVGSLALHDAGLSAHLFADPWMVAAWSAALVFVLAQLVLAWLQKAYTVTRRQQAQLDRLWVTVNIPVYNEDPAILDRTIYALFMQTRLPDHVQVVDDGSAQDYREVYEWWRMHHPPGVRFSWARQENAGKKHAQSVTFTSDHDADIFVTIDSDSALDCCALDEGLKPFADPRIVSVAGLETAFNYDTNILTRAISARSVAFQLFAMSAQSKARGNVLINPGAFSLYRADLIREVVPAYLGETFFGCPVTLGDDTALTMFALCRGRAVHQPSAVSMPVYPETVSHHLRQWTRWMRASTIRTFWRLRYLPVLSYGWLYVVYTLWAFLTSVAITIVIPLAWPATGQLAIASGIALVAWPFAIAIRIATIRRSDQRWYSKLAGVLLLPAAALWYLVVLRQIRFYGIATCARQHWVTREKVEVKLHEDQFTRELAA